MAADILQSPMKPYSARRNLFGRPSKAEMDQFEETSRQSQQAEALRFKLKWNFDVMLDGEVSSKGDYTWFKSASESDLPDFYTKPMRPHKCKRLVTPYHARNLSFMDSDDGLGFTPVDCVGSTVDVYIGMRREPPVTPARVSVPPTPSKDDVLPDSDSSPSVSPEPSPARSFTNMRQCRLTDRWRVRKRSRSLSSSRNPASKRERVDAL